MFKESLFESLGWSDREWSRRIGGASMRLLYTCAAELLAARQSVVLEANFYPRWDMEPLLELQRAHGCRFAQVLCEAPGSLLVERFRQRQLSGARHPGHEGTSPDGRAAIEQEIERLLLSGPWPTLPLDGPLIRIETSDFQTIDYASVVTQLSSHRPTA
jgi:hypothetical protein